MKEAIRVAIDVGSQFHQVAIGDEAGEVLEEFGIDHARQGFADFFARIGRHHASDIRVAMEGYNGWARPLDQQILARGWRLYNVNNLKLARYKEIFPAPAKTDAIDARRILELFAFDGHRSIAGNTLQEILAPQAAQRQLKYLTRRRRHHVSERSARLTRLRCDLQAVCPDLLALTKAVDNRWFLHLLTCRDQLTALPRLHKKTLAAIRGIGPKTLAPILTWQKGATFGPNIELADADIVTDARAILQLDEQISRLNDRIDAVAATCANAQRLRSMPGFGATGAAELAGEIGELRRFTSEAGLAVYLGMAPLDHSSGLRRAAVPPRCVNAQCQRAMMTCVARHMHYVPESRAYYDRKRAQGKRHNQAIRALGRHLTRVIWKMLNEERDYVRKEA